MDDADREAWRAWGQNAPAYAMEFFGGGECMDPLAEIATKHGRPLSDLKHILELVEDTGTKVTIILQPEGEY